MSRTTRISLVAVCAAAAALSAGCAAGQSAATLQIHPNLPAAAAGSLQAENIVVVVDPASNAAQLTGTVVNNGDADDQLVQVSIDGKDVAINDVTVGAHSAVNLAPTSNVVPTTSGKIVQTASTSKPGMISPVVLTFSSGASVQLDADTAANTGIYADYTPGSTT